MFARINIPVMLFLAVLATQAGAHTGFLLPEIDDAGDLRIETGFSDGSTGAGLTIELLSIETGETISTHEIPEGGIVTVPLPEVPYEILMDAGEGHRVTKDGPLPLSAPDAKIELVNVQGGDRDRWNDGQNEIVAAAKVVVANEYLFDRIDREWSGQTLVIVDHVFPLGGNHPMAQDWRKVLRERIQTALDAGEDIVVLTHASSENCPDWGWLYDDFDIGGPGREAE